MLEKLRESNKKVVGTRRLCKAIVAGQVEIAYVAMDADIFIFRQVKDAAINAGIRVEQVETMKMLGEACGVQVPTASAGILK